MAELLALLRGPNRAFSSSTPPLAHWSMVDPALWVPPTHAQISNIATAPAPTVILAPIPPPMHVLAIHPVDILQPSSTIPAIVPLLPMTIPTPDPAIFAPPPMSVPAPAIIYTIPPPMAFLASSAPAPAQTTEHFSFLTLQPHISLHYQVPPPNNIHFP
ncbi:leucine-rich repeat extensin-like protein 3 [Punica granatum]|uniref:Leucine-rich repeat extensin-like protein 3 n=1 Tax=Punica granatum TaxID=22663 RepID=A0A6P8CTP6_PUNGR|nr:leucine-rich repeat extensin-like protein 3 [Punica granatum]